SNPWEAWKQNMGAEGGWKNFIPGYTAYSATIGRTIGGLQTASSVGSSLARGNYYGAGRTYGGFLGGASFELGLTVATGGVVRGLSFRPTANMFRLHKRITTPGYAEVYGRGYGYGQYDAGHRATTFLRNEILQNGKYGIKNWKTIFINYELNSQNFSIGINPWKRTIFHEAPGIFK
ncbi:hypothetical protein, partial [Aquimarina algiphila]